MDDGTAVIPFSAKLAASENWSAEFTQRAIEEYKKFILLCCISEKGASPSQTVDEVWHLHLTYTQSYWIDFCRNTLGKDIHHHPSAGGDQENHKHREWYKETLQLYRTVFGAGAPADIWPPPSSDWRVPEDPPLHFDLGTIVMLVGILFIPFLFIEGTFHTFSPFRLNGPQFLEFFPWYGVAIILAYIVYRWQIKKNTDNLVEAYFPDDITVFQIAAFLYGKHRGLQAGILDLINRGLLEPTNNGSFQVKNIFYTADLKESNPLLAVHTGMPEGSIHSYESMLGNWYDRENFSHPALEALQVFAQRREPFLQLYPFHIAFFGMILARACQGILHHKPIILLLIYGGILSVLFFIAVKLSKRSFFVHRKLNRLFKAFRRVPSSPDDRTLQQFALKGFPAINGSTEGLMLAGIFAAYTPTYLHNTGNDWNSYNSWYMGGSGDNSNGGSSSSCGSGSSCSGSSCGGGGGCGGCSGGGD